MTLRTVHTDLICEHELKQAGLVLEVNTGREVPEISLAIDEKIEVGVLFALRPLEGP